MGERGKGKIRSRDYLIYPDCFQDKIALTRQRRIDIAYPLPGILLGGNSSDPDTGMTDENAQKFNARIASGTQNRHAQVFPFPVRNPLRR